MLQTSMEEIRLSEIGINYNTFLRYMKTDVDKLLGQAEKQKEEACISVYEQADLQTEP